MGNFVGCQDWKQSLLGMGGENQSGKSDADMLKKKGSKGVGLGLMEL